MALYGENLAAAIGSKTTWGQGTSVCKTIEDALQSCYSSLSGWQDFQANGTLDAANRAIWQAISPTDEATIKADLDESLASVDAIDSMILDKINSEGEDAVMADDYRDKLRASVAAASQTVALGDSAFHTSFAGAVSDAIVPVVGGISDKIANALSAILGNFLAGIWWVIPLAVVAVWFWRRGFKAVT